MKHSFLGILGFYFAAFSISAAHADTELDALDGKTGVLTRTLIYGCHKGTCKALLGTGTCTIRANAHEVIIDPTVTDAQEHKDYLATFQNSFNLDQSFVRKLVSAQKNGTLFFDLASIAPQNGFHYTYKSQPTLNAFSCATNGQPADVKTAQSSLITTSKSVTMTSKYDCPYTRIPYFTFNERVNVTCEIPAEN